MKLRKAVFWLHLIAGVVAGLVILIMSVTGVLLTYERQITAWADREYWAAPPQAGASRLPVETLLGKLREAEPDAKPSAVTLRSESDAPLAVSFGRERTVFMNPYTGAVLGEGSKGVREFFHTMVVWHRWLGAEGENRAMGKAITGACNLAFLMLVVSGFYLWWPRSWNLKALKAVTIPSLRLKGKARDFNWHNAIGLWSAPALFIVVLTATVFSYPWANDLVYRMVGEEPPARNASGRGRGTGGERQGGAKAEQPAAGNMDALWARAEQQVPGWQSIQLRLPVSAAGAVSFSIDRGNGARPDLRSQLTLDPKTAEVVKHETFESNSLGRQLRSWVRWVHTGEAGGIIGQTIAGLASLGGAFLVWTGIALTCRRVMKKFGKGGASSASEEKPMAEIAEVERV